MYALSLNKTGLFFLVAITKNGHQAVTRSAYVIVTSQTWRQPSVGAVNSFPLLEKWDVFC